MVTTASPCPHVGRLDGHDSQFSRSFTHTHSRTHTCIMLLTSLWNFVCMWIFVRKPNARSWGTRCINNSDAKVRVIDGDHDIHTADMTILVGVCEKTLLSRTMALIPLQVRFTTALWHLPCCCTVLHAAHLAAKSWFYFLSISFLVMRYNCSVQRSLSVEKESNTSLNTHIERNVHYSNRQTRETISHRLPSRKDHSATMCFARGQAPSQIAKSVSPSFRMGANGQFAPQFWMYVSAKQKGSEHALFFELIFNARVRKIYTKMC